MTGLENSMATLIPQRQPFVMVDQLTSHNEEKTCSRFLIRDDNIFVENHQFSEAGLVENIAQTAAARAGYASWLDDKPVQLGYIGAIKNLAIYALPWVNDELLTEVTVENQIFDVTIVKGKVSCNNILLAACEMKIFIP